MFNLGNVDRLLNAFEIPKPKLIIKLILSDNGLSWHGSGNVAMQRDYYHQAKAEGCEHSYHEELPAGMTPWLPYMSMKQGVETERRLEVFGLQWELPQAFDTSSEMQVFMREKLVPLAEVHGSEWVSYECSILVLQASNAIVLIDISADCVLGSAFTQVALPGRSVL